MAAPAGLYLHVPFCSAVCPYCDFAVQIGAPAVRSRFVAALIDEVALWSDWHTPIDSIYIGGGTPSLLSVEALSAILDAAATHLPVVTKPKLYLEANPEDVDDRRAQQWRALGFSTVSLGVQSFVGAELKRLGRRHSPQRARESVRQCLDAGFDTVSVDSMFGLPEQSERSWRESLDALIALGPQHVSCYQLTIHEGTTFGRWKDRGKLAEMPEDAQARMFGLTHEVLGEAGWAAYEVSNFALAPKHQSYHNRKYWQHAPYLGLGPSAHSFDGYSRWWNHRALGRYMDHVNAGEKPIAQAESLDAEALALETLFLGLRTAEGVCLADFERRFGWDLVGCNRKLVDTLVAEGLLRQPRGRLQPTRAGFCVADGMAARFALRSGVS